MTHLSRRQFVQGVGVAGLGLLAGCGRLPGQESGETRPPGTIHRIGVLAFASPQRISPFLETFRQGLRNNGYVEGRDIAIDARYGEGVVERLPELAAQLMTLGVDVLLTQGTPSTIAAKDASNTVPIVFVEAGNPVGTGLVASFARPGGHLTGVAGFGPDLAAKRLQVLQETAPWISRIAVFRVPTPANEFEWAETQRAAQLLGLELRLVELRGADDWTDALPALTQENPNALLMLTGTGSDRMPIREFAAHRRLPTMTPDREYVSAGFLIAYGPSIHDMWLRAAGYVDRIIKGAKPADLPVERPREFDFVINLKTAQALGLTIPEHVLLQATEVIQ